MDIEEKVDFRLAEKTAFPHYLGAIIVEGVKPTSGNEVSRMLVIDGQQRLTTMQLLERGLACQKTPNGFGGERLSIAVQRALSSQCGRD